MRFSQILQILQTHNDQWQTTIQENTGISITSSKGIASIEGKSPSSGCDCFCGLLKGQASNVVTLARRANLLHPSSLVGVLNVADPAHSADDTDLPVVVCCGINYGQLGSLTFPVGLTSPTGMTGFVQTAVSSIQGVNRCQFPFPANFHLVATNVFPWISASPWSGLGLNSIEEAMLIHCLADRDPSQRLTKLIQDLNPCSVFFHGANNYVPAFANHAVKGADFPKTEVIYCDNLSQPFGPANAIRLCKCHGKQTGCPPRALVSEDGVAKLQE